MRSLSTHPQMREVTDIFGGKRTAVLRAVGDDLSPPSHCFSLISADPRSAKSGRTRGGIDGIGNHGSNGGYGIDSGMDGVLRTVDFQAATEAQAAQWVRELREWWHAVPENEDKRLPSQVCLRVFVCNKMRPQVYDWVI
jgi:hypothetical protein